MPTFDVVSQVDMQEIRNAVDQASREVSTRYDFKGTDSKIELTDKAIELHTESDQRLKALTQVLEEKLVKRKVSLKVLGYGNVEEAAKGTVRQTVSLNVGIPGVVIEALNHGYNVVLVTDCVAGYPADYAKQVIEHGLGRITTRATAQELLELWRA